MQVAKLQLFKSEQAHVGRLCVARLDSGWCRGRIQSKDFSDNKWNYKIFFVDYGDYNTCLLDDLRVLSQNLIDRLPFQAIACCAQGLEPSNPPNWSREEIEFFTSLTRDSENMLGTFKVKPVSKEALEDAVTRGQRYLVDLFHLQGSQVTDMKDLFMKWRSGEPVVLDAAGSNRVETEQDGEDEEKEAKQPNALEVDEKFDVSNGWVEFFNAQKDSVVAKDKNEDESQIVDAIYPTKSSSSVFPISKWCQNDEKVIVTFMVGEVGCRANYDVQFTANHLTFSTTVAGKRYSDKSIELLEFIQYLIH